MSDKAAATKKKLAQNADKITIGVLAVILLALGYMWWQEQSSGVSAASAEGRPASLEDSLAENPAMTMLQTMSDTPDITQDPNALRLLQHSMFDSSTFAVEQAAEAQAVQRLPAIKQMIEAGQTDEAREQLLQVVPVIRYNKEAVSMLESVTTPTVTAESDPYMTDPNMAADPNAVPAY